MKASSTSISEKEHFLSPILMKKLGWGIIVLFVLFLPFQSSIYRALRLPDKFLWMDEVFVAFAFTLFFFILIYWGRLQKRAAQILLVLFFLGVVGIFSGLYNANPFIITANGIFDYIKNFLVIPIVAFFSISPKKARGLYKLLHCLALFLCLVAILQVMAFLIKFPLGEFGILPIADVRFGIPRTPSLMGHPNIFGLYALLFFILDFSLYRKIRWQNMLFASGVFFSVSRMVWVAFFITLLFLLVQGKSRKTRALFIVATIIIALAVPSFYLRTAKDMGSESYFRGYALTKSIEIWKGQPFLGVGPGMYGGVVSLVFHSPIYEQYQFSPHWFAFMSGFHSLDQFWPQILAEMGLIGTFCFGVLLFVLWKVPKKAILTAKDEFRKRMLLGFSVVPVVLFVYLFGSGLNLTAFLLTYGVLFGLVLGMKDENSSSQ